MVIESASDGDRETFVVRTFSSSLLFPKIAAATAAQRDCIDEQSKEIDNNNRTPSTK